MGIFNNINFKKLKNGLSKTRNKIFNSFNEAVTGKAIVDEELLNKIEEVLISSDIGFDTAEQIVDNARIRLREERNRSIDAFIDSIKTELTQTLNTEDKNNKDEFDFNIKPLVILVVGVNGTGKTTTVGKLAYNFTRKGLRVLVGAADTFRAAAGEQLDIWAERAGADIYQKKNASDPSSVAFDTVKKALKENYDICLIDTAGRLHSKHNLMDELGKIKRVIGKIMPGAPHEIFLVLDATTGQNAVIQAEEFSRVTDLSGLIVTKLDGSAKGGVIFQICKKLNVPVKYIGVGESIDDLQPFNSRSFIDALFNNK
ncbi:MAG: signal recognition particle-docking protein FtsY [Ignavibacteriaceae bacterium]